MNSELITDEFRAEMQMERDNELAMEYYAGEGYTPDQAEEFIAQNNLTIGLPDIRNIQAYKTRDTSREYELKSLQRQEERKSL